MPSQVGARRNEVALKILDEIEQRIDESGTYAPGVVQLAEALAWVVNPGQPHGGSSVPEKKG